MPRIHTAMPSGPPALHDELAHAVSIIRTNCHISDALHATDYTLCVYLLKMREYYRWEHAIPFNAPIPQEDLSGWLTGREALWSSLEDEPFASIPLSAQMHDPFDADPINAVLNGMGYVYSSGLGRNLKPHFFLGALEQRREHEGYTLYISGREYARDLTAPPAMSLGSTIFIRRESLRRMLWEKIEEWRWNRPVNAMQKAIACYDFDTAPEEALEQMTERETRSLLLHEIGEIMAGRELGEEWENALSALPRSKAELLMRAVRDHLSDALSTLPGLLDEAEPASLHFYFANLTSLRRMLFPGLFAAYEQWTRTGELGPLRHLIEAGREHWSSLARDIIALHDSRVDDLQQEITALVETRTL
jgi:Family of unknown function (DUF6866) C-terminal domain/Family of unknown function (DUF6866) N-terminal domain